MGPDTGPGPGRVTEMPAAPQDRLRLAESAFAHGDLRRSRRLARALLGQDVQGVPDDVRQQARALLRRTGPDRAAIVVAVACVVFLVVVFLVYAGGR